MKKVFSSISLLLVISAAFFSLSSSSVKVPPEEKLYELKYQLEAGTKFIMMSTGATEIVTGQMETEVIADIEGKAEGKYVVLSSDKERGLTIELEMGERSQEFRSEMESTSTDYSELIGKKVKFVLLSNGEVTDFEGFEDLPEITTSAGELLTKDIYILGVKEAFPKLPDKPIKLGETWSDIEDIDVPYGSGMFKSEKNYTYKLVEELEKNEFDCLKIEIAGIEKLSGDIESQGTPLSVERETSYTGVIYFAYKKGMFIYVEEESSSEGIITVQGAGIPQKITSKSTVTVQFE